MVGERYMDTVDAWMYTPQQQILPTITGLTPHQVHEVQALAASGTPRSALLPLLPAAPVPPDDPDARRHVAEVLAQAEAPQAAADPEGAALLLTRAGRKHFYQGDFTGAAVLMRAAVAQDGGGLAAGAEAHYRVAQCYWSLRDPQCIAWYRSAIKLGLPSNVARFGLVDGLTWAGQYREALEALHSIRAQSPHERATILAAGGALQFLVHDLGLDSQERHEPTGAHLDTPSLEALVASDATSAALWGKLPATDPRHSYQFARAWFGNSAQAWLLAALVMSRHESKGRLVEFLGLALSRSVDLGINGDAVLDVMAAAGLPVDRTQRALDRARRPGGRIRRG